MRPFSCPLPTHMMYQHHLLKFLLEDKFKCMAFIYMSSCIGTCTVQIFCFWYQDKLRSDFAFLVFQVLER